MLSLGYFIFYHAVSSPNYSIVVFLSLIEVHDWFIRGRYLWSNSITKCAFACILFSFNSRSRLQMKTIPLEPTWPAAESSRPWETSDAIEFSLAFTLPVPIQPTWYGNPPATSGRSLLKTRRRRCVSSSLSSFNCCSSLLVRHFVSINRYIPPYLPKFGQFHNGCKWLYNSFPNYPKWKVNPLPLNIGTSFLFNWDRPRRWSRQSLLCEQWHVDLRPLHTRCWANMCFVAQDWVL